MYVCVYIFLYAFNFQHIKWRNLALPFYYHFAIAYDRERHHKLLIPLICFLKCHHFTPLYCLLACSQPVLFIQSLSLLKTHNCCYNSFHIFFFLSFPSTLLLFQHCFSYPLFIDASNSSKHIVSLRIRDVKKDTVEFLLCP